MDTTAIQNVRVRTMTVDEWYGIEVQFDWATPLETVPDEFSADARRLFATILPFVLSSEAYATYYANPHQVSVDENGSDTTQRVRTIPRFSRPEQFEQFDFTRTGGYLLASQRD
jgi:hypothetical protein